MGTTLSMEEIMQRLVDQAQFDLQVCTHCGCALDMSCVWWHYPIIPLCVVQFVLQRLLGCFQLAPCINTSQPPPFPSSLSHLGPHPPPPRPTPQEAERNLCTHLNTLAMRLMAKAEDAAAPAKQSGGTRAQAAAAAAAAGSDDEGDSGDDEDEEAARPAKRPRRSKSGVEALGREALLARALLLLEQSFRVAEKGIAGEGWAWPDSRPGVKWAAGWLDAK